MKGNVMRFRTSMAAAMCASALLTGCIDYSDGERTGVVNKFSKKGLLCKTWEGEMNLGGFRNKTTASPDGKSTQTNVVANVWEFTVENEDLAKKIQAKVESGDPVTITYRQEYFTAPCRNDSTGNYFAVAVR